jgi:hypothetical protein
MKAQLAIGHDGQGNPTALWDLPTLAGAGALRSNMTDMLTFLGANVGEPGTALERAIRVSHQARMGTDLGLAWCILSVGRDKIVLHAGGTGGYRSLIGFDPARRVGVVLLTNSAMDANDIGLHLMTRAFPLTPRPVVRSAIEVPVDILARYVGEYQYLQQPTLKVTLSVTLEHGGLMVQVTGRDKAPIFAESDTKFFARTANAQFTFLTDAAGLASGLILHQSRSSRTVKPRRGRGAGNTEYSSSIHAHSRRLSASRSCVSAGSGQEQRPAWPAASSFVGQLRFDERRRSWTQYGPCS